MLQVLLLKQTESASTGLNPDRFGRCKFKLMMLDVIGICSGAEGSGWGASEGGKSSFISQDGAVRQE
jgi:hypothetical protein